MAARTLRALAPGKVNLALLVGPVRSDGLHELVSLIQPVSLADELELSPLAPSAPADEVLCPGVGGPNLVQAALAEYRREAAWRGDPVRVSVVKRVPVAAGMGGGSADAAAALRLAAHAAGRPDDAAAAAVAPRLGSDVPALLRPSLTLIAGAGETVVDVPEREPFALVLVPSRDELSTAAVYREADRLGLARPAPELHARRSELLDALERDPALPPLELLVNDLEAAAVSLLPAIKHALDAVRGAGAAHALVSGSGPTVFGLFPGAEGAAVAAAAAAELAERWPGALAAAPVAGDFVAIQDSSDDAGA